jgi:hypothetical protein
MASDIDLGDDDGFANVTIQDVTLTLDVFQVNDRIADYHRASKDKPNDAYGAGLIGLIESLGYPRCSARLAQRFVEAISARVKELAGNP